MLTGLPSFKLKPQTTVVASVRAGHGEQGGEEDEEDELDEQNVLDVMVRPGAEEA